MWKAWNEDEFERWVQGVSARSGITQWEKLELFETRHMTKAFEGKFGGWEKREREKWSDSGAKVLVTQLKEMFVSILN